MPFVTLFADPSPKLEVHLNMESATYRSSIEIRLWQVLLKRNIEVLTLVATVLAELRSNLT